MYTRYLPKASAQVCKLWQGFAFLPLIYPGTDQCGHLWDFKTSGGRGLGQDMCNLGHWNSLKLQKRNAISCPGPTPVKVSPRYSTLASPDLWSCLVIPENSEIGLMKESLLQAGFANEAWPTPYTTHLPRNIFQANLAYLVHLPQHLESQ